MAKKVSKNAVVPAKDETALVAAGTYDEFEGAGFENQTHDDLLLPFIYLLQSNSPAVAEGEFKPGMFYNTVTEQATEELLFVPAITRHECVAWKPDRGGFAGTYPMDHEVVLNAKERSADFKDWKTPEGDELQETFNVFGVVCNDKEVVCTAVIPFASKKIKPYRKFMSRLRMFMVSRKGGVGKYNPPLFSNLVLLTSVSEENKFGKYRNVVFNAAINDDLGESMMTPDDPRFQAAYEVYKLVKAGTADANYEKLTPEPGADDEEAPF